MVKTMKTGFEKIVDFSRKYYYWYFSFFIDLKAAPVQKLLKK